MPYTSLSFSSECPLPLLQRQKLSKCSEAGVGILGSENQRGQLKLSGGATGVGKVVVSNERIDYGSLNSLILGQNLHSSA